MQRVLYDIVGRDNLSPATTRAGESMSRLERTTARVGKAIAVTGAAVGAAAAIIAVESVKAAANFQSSMEKIHTQAGATQKDVESLTASVLKMAPSAQQGPQELAQAMFHLKSVGLDNAKAMRALRAASDLAAVGGANLEDTTNAIAGAWRSGIKGANSFAQAAGTVNAIIGAGNMQMEDFVQSLSSGILPAARTFGVSLKSVGSAMALMTDEGIPAELAATRLRMTLSLIGAPSAKAAGELKTIGLSSTALANAMRSPGGLVAAVGLLKDHLDASGLSATKQAQLISNAFGGGRSSSAIMTMLNNLSVLERKQKQINDTTSKFGGDVAAQRKTATAQFALLRSAVDTVGIRIGLALLPPVTKFVTFLAKTVVPDAITAGKSVGHAFESVIPVKAIEDDWRKLLRFLGLQKPKAVTFPVSAQAALAATNPMPHLQDLINLPPQKTSVPVSVDLLHGGKQPGLFAPAAPKAMAQNLASTLSAALHKIQWGQVIATAISSATSSANAIGNAFLAIMSNIDWARLGSQSANAAVPFVVSMFNNLGSAFLGEAIHHPLDLLAFFAALVPIGRVAGIAEKLFGEIPLLGPIIKMFTKPLAAAGRVVEKFFGGVLKGIFGGTARKIVDLFAGARGWLLSKGDDIVQGLLLGVERRWPRVANWLAGRPNAILRFFGAATGWLLSKGADVITGLWRGLERKFPAVTGFVRSIGPKITGFFGSAASWLLNAGGQIIHGLLTGIRRYMAGIGSWIKGNIVDPVINAVKGFFGIHSPSTVMAGIGAHLMSGLFKGIMSHDLGGFVKKVFGSFPSALGHMVEKGIVSIAALPGKALKALGGLGSKALGFLGHLFGGGGGAGVQQWAPTVLRVLGMLGQPASDLGVVLSQMNTESGGNPNAINLTDSNARAGDPSRGLMQTIGSTFAAYAGPFRGLGIYNPLANIYAGLNYAIHRYGAGWTSVLGHGHGYAEGTRGAKPGWAMVGERGMELVRFRGGEDVIEHGASMRILRGYAKGTLTKKQEEGLRLFDSFMNHPSSKSTIHSDFTSLIKEIRKFYDGAKQRWRVQDAHRAEDKMERKSRQLSQVRSQIAAARSYAKSTQGNLASYAQLSNVTLPAAGIVNGTPVATGSTISSGLRDKLNSLRQFGAAIRKLHARHLSGALLRQIVNMGPDDGLAYANAILTGGGGIISQLNQTEKEIGKTAKSVSRSAADALYDKGKDAGKGFLSGLKGERAGLEREMRRMADHWGREAVRWLNVPQSALPHHHHHRHRRVHHRAFGGLITEPVIGYGMHSGDEWQFGEGGTETVTPGSRQAPVYNFEVRVFVGDREITDIVRTEISEKNRSLRRRVVAGAGRAP